MQPPAKGTEDVMEKKIGGRDRWEVEQDLRAIKDAKDIKGDKKRFKAVSLLVKQEMSALESIAAKDKKGLGCSDDDD